MNRCVIITGSSGFLGTYLARQCKNQGFQVTGVNRRPASHAYCDREVIVNDVSDAPWDTLFEQYQPETLFHLAATASVQASIQDPVGDFSKVIPATAAIMVSLYRHSPKTHMVLFSSAAVYGNPSILPIPEAVECAPISPYGANKYVAEQLLKAFSSCYGIRCSILRIFSAYGAGLRRQLFFDVAMKARAALASNQKEIVLYGTGDESRDFIHAKDTAHAALLIADAPSRAMWEVYNVASGNEVSVRSAVETLLDAARWPLQCRFNHVVREGDPKRWRACIGKLEQLGYVPANNLAAGLADYARWLASEPMNTP